MSRKNVALVTVTPEDINDSSDEHVKLLEFFLNQKKPGYGE